MPEAIILNLQNSPMVTDALKGSASGEKVTLTGTVTTSEEGYSFKLESVKRIKVEPPRVTNPLDYILKRKRR